MRNNGKRTAQVRAIYAQSQGFASWGDYLAHKIAVAKQRRALGWKPPAEQPQQPMRKPWEIVGWTKEEYYQWLDNLSNAEMEESENEKNQY